MALQAIGSTSLSFTRVLVGVLPQAKAPAPGGPGQVARQAGLAPGCRVPHAPRLAPLACALTVDPGQPEVGSNFQTIQHAVDCLPNPGPCFVTVKAGTYHEDVEIKSKNYLATSDSQRIVIQADAPLSATVDPSTLSGASGLCGGWQFRRSRLPLLFGSGSTRTAFITIKGFAITGATSDGVNIFSSGTSTQRHHDRQQRHPRQRRRPGRTGRRHQPRHQQHPHLDREQPDPQQRPQRGDPRRRDHPRPTSSTTVSSGTSGAASAGRERPLFLVNNLFVANGTATSGTGNCKCGIGQASGGSAASITLKNNMFYKNGAGHAVGTGLQNVNDIDDPADALDATDSGNYTTTGHANNIASPTTGITGCTFGDCSTTHAFTEIFVGVSDFHLKTGVPYSPAIDKGLNSFVDGGLEWVPTPRISVAP